MKAALTACSNPVSLAQQEDIKRLTTLLEKEGLEVVTSPYLFGCDENFPERIKAKDLTGYFNDGVFEQINGILLGTFSVMEDEYLKPTIMELVQEIIPQTVSIAVTRYIGHRTDARAIVIGREYIFGR